MRHFLEAATRAAEAAGQILIERQAGIVSREKGPRDFVTEADLASQQCIRELLLGSFPDHDFLGEEDNPSIRQKSNAEYRWIVDPLDGTTNYVHRLQTFAVSIALERRGEVVVAVIYDPVAKELFSAISGEGAWCNGQALRTSGCTKVDAALVAASFAAFVDRDSEEIKRFVEAVVACRGVRRLGSAALNLAYVAAGRLDAYWATSVKIWDVAAGVLLVQEAGGRATHLAGTPLNLEKPELLSTATPELHADLLKTLALA